MKRMLLVTVIVMGTWVMFGEAGISDGNETAAPVFTRQVGTGVTIEYRVSQLAPRGDARFGNEDHTLTIWVNGVKKGGLLNVEVVPSDLGSERLIPSFKIFDARVEDKVAWVLVNDDRTVRLQRIDVADVSSPKIIQSTDITTQFQSTGRILDQGGVVAGAEGGTVMLKFKNGIVEVWTVNGGKATRTWTNKAKLSATAPSASVPVGPDK